MWSGTCKLIQLFRGSEGERERERGSVLSIDKQETYPEHKQNLKQRTTNWCIKNNGSNASAGHANAARGAMWRDHDVT